MERPVLGYTTGTPLSVGGGHHWHVPFTAYLFDRALLPTAEP
jgi:hypothetical protein